MPGSKPGPSKSATAASCLFCESKVIDDAGKGVTEDTAVFSGAQALDTLVTRIRRDHGSAVNAILYYGSCLRSNDPFDGIVDLYLIADSYRAIYPGSMRAFSNWLLPPNVFYRELVVGDRVVRVKYNVLSTVGLHRGVSGKRLHSYFWGRFVQPLEILWSRDEAVRRDVESCLHEAVHTFLDRVLPTVAANGAVHDLWEQGLGLSYSAELRSESPDRARQLVAYALGYYVTATRQAAPSLRYPLQISGAGTAARYQATVSGMGRMRGSWAWAFTRILGKVLSLARLVKALFTFEGGLDYAAWKLGRHSGQTIEIPDRVRQHPLIFVWPLLWKLYRRGVIR